MKKYYVLIVFLFIIFTAPEIYSYENEFIGKIGTSYAKEPAKFGLDISVNYLLVLGPFFAAGLEADFFWLEWERTLGTKEVGQTTAEVKAKTNAYTIPVFFNAQLRLPNLAKFIYVEPSLTVGLGYAFLILDDSIPEYTEVSGPTHEASDELNFYGGFAWQVIASIAFKPGEESKINFTFDIGYRGAYPENDGIEFNMSGFLTRVGVKFKF